VTAEKIIGAIIVILLAWVGTSIINLEKTVAGLAEKYALRTEVESVRQDLSLLRAEVQRIAQEQARRTALFPQFNQGYSR
jgi:hypothetical protein